MHDLEGALRTVNPAAARSPGYQPQECAGRNVQEFLSLFKRHLFGAYLERLRQHHTDDGRVITKTGDERVSIYHPVYLEEAGEPPYVLGHAQGITDRLHTPHPSIQFLARISLEGIVERRHGKLMCCLKRILSLEVE